MVIIFNFIDFSTYWYTVYFKYGQNKIKLINFVFKNFKLMSMTLSKTFSVRSDSI